MTIQAVEQASAKPRRRPSEIWAWAYRWLDDDERSQVDADLASLGVAHLRTDRRPRRIDPATVTHDADGGNCSLAGQKVVTYRTFFPPGWLTMSERRRRDAKR